MDKEYGTMFKQLIHERNELRKYIIDICKSLDINTSQSVLGANCLEFYAVLSSVAKDRMKDLQEQLKRKEQECEELKHEVELMMDCESCKIDEYKQTLTEIKDMCSEMNCESLMQNSWYGNTDFKMGCCEKLFKKQILQKIREYEVENE